MAKYPRMRYHPETGEAFRVEKPEHDDPSWLDCHPQDPRRKLKQMATQLQEEMAKEIGKETDAPDDLNPDEVRATLTGGGVEFDPATPDGELYALLISSLRKALDGKGVSYLPGDNAKALLAKLEG